MSSWKKCHVGKMANWENIELGKCQFGKMSSWEKKSIWKNIE
jgi:hypothetical protein